jgi:hypothetical protein
MHGIDLRAVRAIRTILIAFEDARAAGASIAAKGQQIRGKI